MVCEYCRKQNPDNLDICTGCGAPLPQPVKQPVQQQKQDFKVGCLSLIVILIIVIVTVILIVNHSKKDSLSVANYDTPVMQVVLTKADFIAECQTYTCEQISVDPDTYRGLPAHFNGEISQVLEDSNYQYYVINVEPDSDGNYSESIYVRYSLPEGAPKIQEDTVVDIYGNLAGLATFEYVAGGEIILPSLSAKYIDLAQ